MSRTSSYSCDGVNIVQVRGNSGSGAIFLAQLGKLHPTPYIWAVSEIRLLFLGDIVGKPGRELVRRGLSSIREHYNVDLVIANAENAAAGRGITRDLGDQLLDWGVDVMTSGNHIWAQREAID